jgi:hypothetical protein
MTAMIAVGFIVSIAAQRGQTTVTSSRGSGTTQIVSPVAASTWMHEATQSDEAYLIVVWRGTPGWFARGNQHSESGGGGGGLRRESVTYGSISLDVSLDIAHRLATIQGGKPISLGQDNVVLVDHVDEPAALTVVKTLRIDDPSLPDRAPRVPLALKRSAEVVAFLRCDLRLPDEMQMLQTRLIEPMCAQLK